MARKKSGRSRNGVGTIHLRADGRWQGSIRHRGQRPTVYGKSREEVEERLEALDLGASDDVRALRYYAEEHAASLAQGSRATYLRTLDLYAKPFVDKPVDLLTPRALSLHLRKLAKDGMSKSILRMTSSLLKTALDIAVEDKALKTNPARELRRKLPGAKESHEVVSWDSAQIAKFEDYIRDIPDYEPVPGHPEVQRAVKRWKEVVFLLRVRHGLRPSEILGLRLEDFHDGAEPYVSIRGQFQRSGVIVSYRPVDYVIDGETVKRVVLPEEKARVVAVRVHTGKTANSLRDIDIDDRTARAIRKWLAVREEEMLESSLTIHQRARGENQARRIAAGIRSGVLPKDSEHFTSETALFTNRPEDACTPVTFEVDTREWKKAVAAAGLPHASRYSGRHSAATRAIEDGVDLKIVSRNLGHGNVSITHSVYVARDAQRAERRAAGSRFKD